MHPMVHIAFSSSSNQKVSFKVLLQWSTEVEITWCKNWASLSEQPSGKLLLTAFSSFSSWISEQQ
jgi:hypothetical protein